MSDNSQIPSSRRRFLAKGIRLAGLAALLLPVQRVLGSGAVYVKEQAGRISRKTSAFFADKIIINTKTKVVHLPTSKLFVRIPEIAGGHQKIVSLQNWESQIKAPLHFDKERSGVVIEILAIQKLAAGINNATLMAATNTLALAFTPMYKQKNGQSFNKYNFRLHELLLRTIALNTSIPMIKKWERYTIATGKINYALKSERFMPKRMDWMKSKVAFDKQAAYIIKNKEKYTERLKERALFYKL